jgi:hypothetical protein
LSKIKEIVHHDDGGDTLTVETVYDNNPVLDSVKNLKDAGFDQQKGDNRLVGRIPMHIMAQWLKEAGVDWSDHGAAQEVIKRKILSGDFAKFRVWEGTY